jgi:hypothetical protein
MAQLVGGIVGAAVGSVFGMPQLGFAVGSALGGIAAQPKPPKPEVGSLAPSEVEYGWPISSIYGTRRIAAWRLYQSDLAPVAQRVETKGSSSRTVGYRYRCNMGLLICRSGPAAAVRIWRNKELVAVFRTDADEADIAASLGRVHWEQATFYGGASGQLPHPQYEADLAPDPVPAYRGYCTLWLDGAWCDGRTPPAIEIEVTTGPEDTLGVVAWTLTTTDIGSYTRAPGSVGWEAPDVVPIKTPSRYTVQSTTGYGGVTDWPTLDDAVAHGYSLAPGYIAGAGETVVDIGALQQVGYSVSGGVATLSYEVSGTTYNFLANPPVYQTETYPFTVQFFAPVVEFASGAAIEYQSTTLSFDASNNAPFGNAELYSGSSDVPAVVVDASTASPSVSQVRVVTPQSDVLYLTPLWNFSRYVLRGSALFLGNVGLTGGARVARYDIGSSAATHSVDLGGGSVAGLACDGTTLFVAAGGGITPLSADNLTSAGATFTAPSDIIFCNSVGNLYSFTGAVLYQRVAGAWVEVLDVTGGLFSAVDLQHPPTFEGGLLSATQRTATGWHGIISLPAVTPQGVLLNTILSSYWQACGIPAAQIDLSETAGIVVDGYTAAGSGAYCTDELSSAFYFSVINTGLGLKTKIRGAASVATIPYADFGVGVDQAVEEPMETDSDSAVEIPRRVSVSVANGAADHEVATETDDRILGVNTQTDSISLALTATPEKAKGIANTIAADRKTSANSNKWPVGLKWIALELGDVVTVTGRQGETRRERLVRESFADWVRAIDTVLDRAADLQDTGVVTQAGAAEPTLTVSVAGTAEVVPIDGPMLRDADNAPGVYLAVDLERAGFAGVFGAASQTGTFEPVANVDAEAGIGTLLTTLRAWNGRYAWDTASTVDVLMADGATLTSSTKAAMSADRAINTALVGSPTRGWELVRFVNATLIATDTYRVSLMLRGKKGTEAQAYTHVPGERFVLVSNALRSAVLDASAVGERWWKAVAAGRNIATTVAVRADFAAVRTRPIAPTYLRCTRDINGNATFRWSPRTRFNTRWRGAVYPPSEVIETYRVELFAFQTFGSAVRTLTVNAAEVTYTAAQQAADGVVTPSLIAVRVRSISQAGQLGQALEDFA